MELRIIQHRLFFYILSVIIVIPGIVFLVLFGLRLGVDFTGGSIVEYSSNSSISLQNIQKVLQENDFINARLTPIGQNNVQIKIHNLNTEQHAKMTSLMQSKFTNIKEVSFADVGPTIGKELKQKAIYATILVVVMIVLYISWSFRKASTGPITSWSYGFAAIIALLHDLLVVLGLFALLGKIAHAEIDSMFLTALLTVLGFSVHDTIVVFDRIRERIRLSLGKESFEELVNVSVQQTLVRSLATSFTVVLVLVALLLFGGETIRYFVIALLVGMISGTYSSIGVASALLVSWNNYKTR